MSRTPTTAEVARAVLSDKALISEIMSALGRKGGIIGGKRRLETMTAEERRERARHAAQVRWRGKAKKSRRAR